VTSDAQAALRRAPFANRWAAIGLLLLLALLLVPLPRVLQQPVWRDAFDLGHIPLFAVAFLVLRHVLRARFRRPELLAALASVAAAGTSELLQLFVGSRSASWGDVVLDLVGVALAWSTLSCWRRSGGWRAAHAALLVGGIAAACVSLGKSVLESRELAAMMPLLAGFEQRHELRRWHAKDGTEMSRKAPGLRGSGWALEVRCSASAGYPGVSIEDFESDWRGYRFLEWSVHVPSAKAFELALRIDDDQGALYGDRYTRLVRIAPPEEVYRVDLREVAAHFREHPMNMAAITEVHFFLDGPKAEQVFSLDEVRLVP